MVTPSCRASACIVLWLSSWCVLSAQSVEDVITLHRAGLSSATIALQIEASGTRYNLTTAELLALKEAGLPESLIQMMVATQRGQDTALSQARTLDAEVERLRTRLMGPLPAYGPIVGWYDDDRAPTLGFDEDMLGYPVYGWSGYPYGSSYGSFSYGTFGYGAWGLPLVTRYYGWSGHHPGHFRHHGHSHHGGPGVIYRSGSFSLYGGTHFGGRSFHHGAGGLYGHYRWGGGGVTFRWR